MMLPLVIAVMPEGADRDYMEWLFVEHHRLMMVTAFGIVPQSADADEIVSDSLIALYKKIDKLRGMEKNALRLYIVSTVRNTSLNYLKKHQRMNSPFLHMPDAVICQIPGRDNTEGKIVLSEELDRVRMAIRELPERECMAIQLKLHLDQMIRLAFAQEAALWAQEWMAQSETPETPQEQERAERLLRRMRAQIDREERAARRRSRSVRLRRIVPRVVEIAACVVLAVAVATPFAIANVEFIRSAVMKLLIRIDWEEGVMQMNLVEDEGAAFNVPADWPGEYFPSYLPEGLEVTWKSYIPGYPCIEYTSESGERVINFSEMGENSTQVNGIEGAVISYMDINGQTAVVIETEHPENEADYYVGIAWDNGEKWFSVDTSGIPKEETIKIARSVKKILKN